MKIYNNKWQEMEYNLRGILKLNLPRVTTTAFGLQSFRYTAPQSTVQNMLPDEIRTSQSLTASKCAIRNVYDLKTQVRFPPEPHFSLTSLAV